MYMTCKVSSNKTNYKPVSLTSYIKLHDVQFQFQSAWKQRVVIGFSSQRRENTQVTFGKHAGWIFVVKYTSIQRRWQLHYLHPNLTSTPVSSRLALATLCVYINNSPKNILTIGPELSQNIQTQHNIIVQKGMLTRHTHKHTLCRVSWISFSSQYA